VIRTLILQALAWQAQGDTLQALRPLERALVLAAPEGYIRIFVDEGDPMAALLRQVHARDITPDYVTALLAAFGRWSERSEQGFVPHPLAGERRPQTHLDEPLTERELEVLRLLAEGYATEPIAAELVVAVGTVKRHIANILGKLEVHNRLQAVARARELGLL
jgi:LuxR family maltose regulon positive regulatory protein